MDNFPLLGLSTLLLEQIINKLQYEEDYFRLQQTCWGMAEFFQTNRNIKYHTVYDCSLFWEEEKDGSLRLGAKIDEAGNRTAGIESLYGIRHAILTPPPGNYDELYELLKKSRITAEMISMYYDHRMLEFTKEQCASLFKIMKPESVSLSSEGSDRFEALFSLKVIKEVRVEIDLDSALSALKRFLASFSVISLHMTSGLPSMTSEQILDVLILVLKTLQSEILPHLRSFRFTVAWTRELPTSEEITKKFRDFNPTRAGDMSSENLECTLQCVLDSPESTCKLEFSYVFATIQLEQTVCHEESK